MPDLYHKRKRNEKLDTERAKTDINYLKRYWYFFYLYRAWPDWAVYPDELRAIYRECHRLRAQGKPYTVDHIVPLRSPLVCGLHVPWNLQVITEAENTAKSNKWWPDSPLEQPAMDITQDQT
jgi:5-methylcytosine-specific restriction endonuclease McrA